MNTRHFAILDRDGTIIQERHYLSDPAQVELLPGAVSGLKQMRKLGLGLIVVTNQSGVARGYFGLGRLGKIHARLRQLLRQGGVKLDGIYFCPHHPDQACSCRKPAPGMIRQAAGDYGFDTRDCFVIGDKPCDVNLGRAAGAVSLLVRTGYGAGHENTCRADHVVDSLKEAAAVIAKLIGKHPGPKIRPANHLQAKQALYATGRERRPVVTRRQP